MSLPGGDDSTLIDRLKTQFASAEAQASPIILDLDGNGIDTVGLSDGVHFDHDGNGFAQLTGWVGGQDGLLVWDRNGNGTIDTGNELFGNNTVMLNGVQAVNGFAALAGHDSNGDGVIDSNDAIWSELRVWRDVARDGTTQEGELVTLDELGITSLSLGYTDSNHIDEHGNAHKQVGSFTRADGTTAAAVDVWFAVDNARTRATEILDVPADIAALPDLQAFGNVHSLHQAMVRDESGHLQGLVQAYAAQTDRTARMALVDQILFHWAGVAGIDPGSRGGSIDARRLHALEMFLGETFNQEWLGAHPGVNAAVLLEDAFGQLQEFVDRGLVLQTHLAPYLDAIGVVLGENGIEFDFVQLEAQLVSLRDEDRKRALELLVDIKKYGGSELASLGWDANDLLLAWVREDFVSDAHEGGYSTSTVIRGSGRLSGALGNDILVGDQSNNQMYGNGGDNILVAVGGHNQMYGGSGNNVFVVGSGYDYLHSNHASSNDVYHFGRGDGHNVVVDQGGSDRVELGAGINETHVTLRRSWSDLVIALETGESLTVKDVFNPVTGELDATRAIETIRFSDGVEWDLDRMRMEALKGTAGNDIIQGFDTDDVIQGGAGNDQLYGGAGNNVLVAGSGNNHLHGGSGNTVFVTGSGTDRMYSSSPNANDVYRFGRGSGQNFIEDSGGSDVIELGDGIDESDISIRRRWSDLVIRLDTGESLTVVGMFAWNEGSLQTSQAIETIRFADGTEWDIDRMRLEALKATGGNDIIYGFETDDVISGGEGDDQLYGGGGNNTLIAGSGNNRLVGGMGDDTLVGGDGNDTLEGVGGNNTLIAGSGDNLLYGGTGSNTFVAGSGYDEMYSFHWNSDDVYRIGRGGDSYIVDYGGQDRIEFDEGIAEEHVSVRRVGRALELRLDTGEYVYVDEMFVSHSGALDESRAIETVRFADGTEWDVDRIRIEAVKGTDGNDRIYGFDTDDVIMGGAGNDVLYGVGGNNTLIGGSGFNQLHGGTGNNVFVAGSGTDVMHSTTSTSNDVYRFGRDSGQNWIYDYGGNDRIELGEGIDADQLWLSRSGSALTLDVIGSGERVSIANWYSGEQYRIETIELSSGAQLAAAHVDALVQAMASFAPPGAGETSIPAGYRESLDPVLAASWQ